MRLNKDNRLEFTNSDLFRIGEMRLSLDECYNKHLEGKFAEQLGYDEAIRDVLRYIASECERLGYMRHDDED